MSMYNKIEQCVSKTGTQCHGMSDIGNALNYGQCITFATVIDNNQILLLFNP